MLTMIEYVDFAGNAAVVISDLIVLLVFQCIGVQVGFSEDSECVSHHLPPSVAQWITYVFGFRVCFLL